MNTTRPTVYLCGTITTDPEHLNWRDRAKDELALAGIDVLSPVRGKNPSDWLEDGTDTNKPLIYDRGGFVARDHRDVRRCDAVLLVFFKAPERQSIGTFVEFGWAEELGKPIIVASDLPEVIRHPFIWKGADRICPTLEEALAYSIFLLAPDHRHAGNMVELARGKVCPHVDTFFCNERKMLVCVECGEMVGPTADPVKAMREGAKP
jgi:nucleoside 2-deoxyribosyltransferase